MNVFSAYWIALLDRHMFLMVEKNLSPIFTSSDMLGNILCKQLAGILKYFPLLKINNKNLC
jgi:hypothetical protein